MSSGEMLEMACGQLFCIKLEKKKHLFPADESFLDLILVDRMLSSCPVCQLALFLGSSAELLCYI